MINDREIAFRLGDVGVAGRKYFLTDGKRAEMNLFRLRKTLLVCIKDAEIIQYGSDIGMFRPELAFVNLKSTEVVWFSGGAAAGLASPAPKLRLAISSALSPTRIASGR